ncbi:MAG TPA: TlyA family RNA methyltransferase, partial [Thermoleophilaceae bacterium]|nr:TlyA family RNA methyltransferase [Thermoleophilaceae bacterium]
LILSGSVRVGDRVVTKAGSRVAPDEPLEVARADRFVSRAGKKLDGALDKFDVRVEDRLCLDAGASTGGFTDALLQRGAERVMAVDVGYGQLDWSLRNDPRVVIMERTNVRRLGGDNLPFDPDLLVADLSFISLIVALERLFSTTPSLREAVVLVKPQFEAGPRSVGRGGLVRDPGVHAEVIRRVADFFERLGFGAVGVARAAVAGRKSGNREYPLHLVRGARTALDEARVGEVVGGG